MNKPIKHPARNYLSDPHKRAARTMGMALIAGDDPETWRSVSSIWAARLSRKERASVLAAAIGACAAEDAVAIIEAAHHDLTGATMIVPPLDSLMGQATSWAECATVAERKAYTLAGFLSLSDPDKHAFVEHVQRRVLK